MRKAGSNPVLAHSHHNPNTTFSPKFEDIACLLDTWSGHQPPSTLPLTVAPTALTNEAPPPIGGEHRLAHIHTHRHMQRWRAAYVGFDAAELMAL